MKVKLCIYSNTIRPLTACQLKETVGNIAQKPKDVTVNWNIPFDIQGGSILSVYIKNKIK